MPPRTHHSRDRGQSLVAPPLRQQHQPSEMIPTATKAAAVDDKPAAPITGAEIEMARAKMGKTGGAKSKMVGKSGRISGPAASCNNGSSLEREIPA